MHTDYVSGQIQQCNASELQMQSLQSRPGTGQRKRSPIKDQSASVQLAGALQSVKNNSLNTSGPRQTAFALPKWAKVDTQGKPTQSNAMLVALGIAPEGDVNTSDLMRVDSQESGIDVECESSLEAATPDSNGMPKNLAVTDQHQGDDTIAALNAQIKSLNEKIAFLRDDNVLLRHECLAKDAQLLAYSKGMEASNGAFNALMIDFDKTRARAKKFEETALFFAKKLSIFTGRGVSALLQSQQQSERAQRSVGLPAKSRSIAVSKPTLSKPNKNTRDYVAEQYRPTMAGQGRRLVSFALDV